MQRGVRRAADSQQRSIPRGAAGGCRCACAFGGGGVVVVVGVGAAHARRGGTGGPHLTRRIFVACLLHGGGRIRLCPKLCPTCRVQDAAEHPKVKPETGGWVGGQGHACTYGRHTTHARRSLPHLPPCPPWHALLDSVPAPVSACSAAEERFGRELGLFVVDGECPRCGRTMEKGHKQHLEGCSGRAPRADRPARRDEALQARGRAGVGCTQAVSTAGMWGAVTGRPPPA